MMTVTAEQLHVHADSDEHENSTVVGNGESAGKGGRRKRGGAPSESGRVTTRSEMRAIKGGASGGPKSADAGGEADNGADELADIERQIKLAEARRRLRFALYPNLTSKIAHIQGCMDRMLKTGKNAEQGYNFMTESDVIDAVRPFSAELNVQISFQVVEGSFKRTEFKSDSGRMAHESEVAVRLEIRDGDSDAIWQSTPVPGIAQDFFGKDAYQAVTGGKKYAAVLAFLLTSGDDPENTSVGRKNREQGHGNGGDQQPPTGVDTPAGDGKEERIRLVGQITALIQDPKNGIEASDVSELIRDTGKSLENLEGVTSKTASAAVLRKVLGDLQDFIVASSRAQGGQAGDNVERVTVAGDAQGQGASVESGYTGSPGAPFFANK